mmetsp:Transcript_144388/g.462600  ORF Transcript_144388/g.462600 Transcript_144388/m.462600 type:complete len:225 (-) Transcript_144388:1659-2333(-)
MLLSRQSARPSESAPRPKPPGTSRRATPPELQATRTERKWSPSGAAAAPRGAKGPTGKASRQHCASLRKPRAAAGRAQSFRPTHPRGPTAEMHPASCTPRGLLARRGPTPQHKTNPHSCPPEGCRHLPASKSSLRCKRRLRPWAKRRRPCARRMSSARRPDQASPPPPDRNAPAPAPLTSVSTSCTGCRTPPTNPCMQLALANPPRCPQTTRASHLLCRGSKTR